MKNAAHRAQRKFSIGLPDDETGRQNGNMSDSEFLERPKPFDLLASLAAFAHSRGISLTDPDLIPTFTADAGEQLVAALEDASLLHGSRTELLFLVSGRFGFSKLRPMDVSIPERTCARRISVRYWTMATNG